MGTETKKTYAISKPQILLVSIIAMVVLLFTLLVLDAPSTVALLTTAMVTISLSMVFGMKWDNLMSEVIIIAKRIYPAILILIFVGMLIGSWTASGTIPALVYYGLKLLSPSIFLPATVIICAVTSIMTGTSWGTLSTAGVALMGISVGLGIPVPYTAGAILVGSYFGDQMSPLSDSTIMSSSLSGANIMDHIRYMMITSIPSILISLVFFTVLGLQYRDGTVVTEEYELILTTLEESFNINGFLLLLPLLVLVLMALQKPTLLVFAVGIVAGVVFSVIFQGDALADTLAVLNSGYSNATGVDIVDTMILRGGIRSMSSSINIIISASVLGGALQSCGAFNLLAEKIENVVKGPKTLILFSYIFNSVLSYTLAGAYTQFALVGPLLAPAYDKYGLARVNISRMLEETTTLLSIFVPWTANGVFILSTLGVSVADYALYTPTIYLQIILSMVCAFTGFKIAKAQTVPADQIEIA